MTRDEEYTTGMAFLLGLACLFGVAGIHRFYLGKKWTGLLYLLTWGLAGIGLVYDAMTMQRLVDNANRKRLRRARKMQELPEPTAPASGTARTVSTPRIETADDMRLILTRTAAANSGSLSVTQGVLATGKPFDDVEKILDEMAKSGYVGIDNDPDSGVVVYTFREL